MSPVHHRLILCVNTKKCAEKHGKNVTKQKAIYKIKKGERKVVGGLKTKLIFKRKRAYT